MANAKEVLFEVYQAGVDAAHPKSLVKKVAFHGKKMIPPLLLGAGKAAGTMASAFLRLEGLSGMTGCIIVPEKSHVPKFPGITVAFGSHPVLSASNIQSTRKLLDTLKTRKLGQEVICVISGGASALLEMPVSGITLAHLQKTTELLLACGASIKEMNVVRKHLSMVKGGRLAQAMPGAACTTFALSDVEGDGADVVGSGPTAPDPSTFADACQILEKYKLKDDMPPAVWKFLCQGTQGKQCETPKLRDPIFRRQEWKLFGSGAEARYGAGVKGRELGMKARVERRFLKGEARELGRELAAIGQGLPPNTLWIGSGEPTVVHTKNGKGGRCQETALSFLLETKGKRPLHFLAAGTDGIDGPTDAAGAYVSNESLRNAQKLKLNPEKYLDAHDSYTFFKRTGDLLQTGPTGTNVNDLFLLWSP